jgi:hypothetical protein
MRKYMQMKMVNCEVTMHLGHIVTHHIGTCMV